MGTSQSQCIIKLYHRYRIAFITQWQISLAAAFILIPHTCFEEHLTPREPFGFSLANY